MFADGSWDGQLVYTASVLFPGDVTAGGSATGSFDFVMPGGHRHRRQLHVHTGAVGYGGARSMGLFQRRRTDTTEIERLTTELSAFRERLDAVDAAKTDLGDRVQRIDDRISQPLSPPPAPPSPGAGENAATPALSRELAALEERLAAVDQRIAALDERITNVSIELANQVSELGNDIDALATRHDGALDDEAVDALRNAQTRLANEQARYQIAFRQDLAELAERLRRPSS